MDNLKQANRRTAQILAVVTVLMIGFGFALVPLYNVFCDITGLNGRVDLEAVQIVEAGDVVASERWVTVTLDSNVQSELPWTFKPEVNKMKVQLGVTNEANYIVSNTSDHDTVGQAIPSIYPGAASQHLRKLECFCFNKQPLAAGEQKAMPLRFVISPELPEDIKSLALSYTFFNIDAAQSSKTAQPDNSEEG